MPFLFNFNVENGEEENNKDDNASGDTVIKTPKTDNKDDPASEDKISKSPEIDWIPAKEHFITEKHFSKVASIEQSETFHINSDNNKVLKFVNSEIVKVSLLDKNYSGDLTPALENSTDLVPGVYEGGLKVWECSEDLVNFLDTNFSQNLQDKKVAELGCGAGLPGIYCCNQGAKVLFNDYNHDVIEETTIPNVLLNKPNREDCSEYYSGDWASLEDILEKKILTEEDKFDLILSSETIYNVSNQSKLVSIFKKFLKSSGVVLVAAKTCYFGVGGGIRQFEKLVRKENMKVTTVETVDTGVTREILQITL